MGQRGGEGEGQRRGGRWGVRARGALWAARSAHGAAKGMGAGESCTHQLVFAIFEDGLDFVPGKVIEREEVHLRGTPRADDRHSKSASYSLLPKAVGSSRYHQIESWQCTSLLARTCWEKKAVEAPEAIVPADIDVAMVFVEPASDAESPATDPPLAERWSEPSSLARE
jgi:hypothetical protein